MQRLMAYRRLRMMEMQSRHDVDWALLGQKYRTDVRHGRIYRGHAHGHG